MTSCRSGILAALRHSEASPEAVGIFLHLQQDESINTSRGTLFRVPRPLYTPERVQIVRIRRPVTPPIPKGACGPIPSGLVRSSGKRRYGSGVRPAASARRPRTNLPILPKNRLPAPGRKPHRRPKPERAPVFRSGNLPPSSPRPFPVLFFRLCPPSVSAVPATL